MILSALLRALPQIFHARARRVLGKTIALTVGLFALFGFGLGWALKLAFEWAGWGEHGYAEAAGAMALTLFLGWLLFRSVAMAVLGLFSDEIVAAVEAESYPAAAARARPPAMAAGVRMALRSAGRNIGWNLLALPFYFALLLTGVGSFALFLTLNAYLLGRDLADMVEGRHPDAPPMGGWQRMLMGLVSALLFLIPAVNLLAPIWSAAMAVHLFHERKEQAA